MIYFVFCTTGCNLHCTYCGNDPEEMCMPLKPTYTVEELQQFLELDYKTFGKKPTLVFYGGEPLVNKEFMLEIMDKVDANFVLQTNATLLHTLTKEQLDKFAAILVSIDGDSETVNRNRGKNTYERCIAGCKSAIEKTHISNLVARGTVMEGNDIFSSSLSLLLHPSIPFSHFYWQLNVGFDCPAREGFEKWVDSNYLVGLGKLMKWWIERMEIEKKVYGIVPFLSLTESFLIMDSYKIPPSPSSSSSSSSSSSTTTTTSLTTPSNNSLHSPLKPVGYMSKPVSIINSYGSDQLDIEDLKYEKPTGSFLDFNKEDDLLYLEKEKEWIKEYNEFRKKVGKSELGEISPVPLRQLRCGIGQTAFSISTDGVISGCPCGVGEEWNTISKHFKEVKDIKKELLGKIRFQPPCTECDIADICGGRCVYCNQTRYWGRDYERLVCHKTVRHLVYLVRDNLPKIKTLLLAGIIKREPFQWPAEEYSLEVIP